MLLEFSSPCFPLGCVLWSAPRGFGIPLIEWHSAESGESLALEIRNQIAALEVMSSLRSQPFVIFILQSHHLLFCDPSVSKFLSCLSWYPSQLCGHFLVCMENSFVRMHCVQVHIRTCECVLCVCLCVCVYVCMPLCMMHSCVCVSCMYARMYDVNIHGMYVCAYESLSACTCTHVCLPVDIYTWEFCVTTRVIALLSRMCVCGAFLRFTDRT